MATAGGSGDPKFIRPRGRNPPIVPVWPKSLRIARQKFRDGKERCAASAVALERLRADAGVAIRRRAERSRYGITSRFDPSASDRSCIDVICGPVQPVIVTAS